MARQTRGTFVPLSFGTTVISGYVNESEGESNSGGEVVIDNEVGDVVTDITGFGKMTEVTLEVIPDEDTDVVPENGDVFAYGIKKMVVRTCDVKKVKKDVEKWSIKGKRFPGVDLD